MMNYVGSVSIIDRGDAPAKAIIDKNTRSLAQRVADETKQELDKVMDRVDNIYVSYEMSTQTMFDNPRGSPNVEYIEDIKELEEIITDAVKKKKYQQQVTVFIVGFQDICAQKMQLLQQVNQFFIENSTLDEEELVEEKPTVDLEEASTKVNESLNTAEELTKRLSDINQDMIDYLINYANTKASNKNAIPGYEKGKKKLEKSLESAKNDVTSLSEKLLTLQAELEEKEEKFQQVVKQLETKSQEALRYKTAAEVAKKSAQENENFTSTLQDEILKRDEKIQELRSKLNRLEVNLVESQFDTELSRKRLDNANAQTKERLAKLQEEVDLKKMAIGDAEREMARMHREQLAGLEKAHQEEIEDLRNSHADEIAKLKEELMKVSTMLTRAENMAREAFEEADELKTKFIEIQLNQKEATEERPSSETSSGKTVGELTVEDEQPASKQESRPSTKDTKSSKKSESKPVIKTTAKSPSRGKEKTKGKDFAEVSVQDEAGDPSKASVEKNNEASRQPTRQSKNLEPVVETGDQEFTDIFDLADEESWSSIPAGHVTGRFAQYRRLSLSKIKELEEQLNVTLTKTHRKVNSLKMQFSEHKNKWENERKILIEQVEQAQKLQTDAEKEADAAMTQLEEFINEQEKLEDEEETKRQEIIKTMSRPGTVKRGTSGTGDRKTERKTSIGEKAEIIPREERLQSENSEQELKNLMQQTDDAKANTPVSRSESGASGLAPWLNSPEKKMKPLQTADPSSDPPSSTSFEPNSRLTSVADAEISNIVPEAPSADKQVGSEINENLKNVKPIDGLRGEREKLQSRTSTRLSRQPKRPLSRNIDEREELQDSDEESRIESCVAPWFAVEPKKAPVRHTPDLDSEGQISQQTVHKSESRLGVTPKSQQADSIKSSGHKSDKVKTTDVNNGLENTSDVDSCVESEEDVIDLQRSKSVEVIGKISRPSVSRIQERSKSTALEYVGKTKTAKEKQLKMKQVKTKPKQQNNNVVKPEFVPVQDPTKNTKESKITKILDKRSKTSLASKPEPNDVRERAKTVPLNITSEDKDQQEDEADGHEMKILLPSEENELISALSSDKGRSASKASNYIGELDSRRSMTGTVAKGKMTQMTDVTLPVAIDTDSESETEDKKAEQSESFNNDIQQQVELVEAEITRPLTDEEKVRDRSRASRSSRSRSNLASRPGFETGRSGAIGGLGIHDNQQTPLYTSQSETLPVGRYTAQSTHQQVVSVEVLIKETPGEPLPHFDTPGEPPIVSDSLQEPLTVSNKGQEGMLDAQQTDADHKSWTEADKVLSPETDSEAQEKIARHQTGAISAPPAVEPDDGQMLKKPNLETPREDDESKPVISPSRKSSEVQSLRNLNQQKPDSTPKEAFRTPRPIQSTSSQSTLSDESIDLDIDHDEGVALDLAPSQTQALNSLKTMMEEEQFNIEQRKTLDSLRSALRTVSAERPLMDVQLERTVTILSLASQIARESIELGILPDGVFSGFGKMDSRAMSVLSGKDVSRKGSALSQTLKRSAKSDFVETIKDEKRQKSEKPHSSPEQYPKPDFQLKPNKKKRQKQRSRSLDERSRTPKLFEIKNEPIQAKPSTQSSAFTMSGSMDMAYASTRGDSFSASLPRTMTSSEWRKMTMDDPLSPKPAEEVEKSGIQRHETQEVHEQQKPETSFKTEENVMPSVIKDENIDVIQDNLDLSVADPGMPKASISIVISPKKKSRQVTVEEMLYGDDAGDIPTDTIFEEKLSYVQGHKIKLVQNVDSHVKIQKSPTRTQTLEKCSSTQSPKPLSAKSKVSPHSPHSQLSPQEPLDSSSRDLKRENSYNSTQTLLTAPTPGTNVTDFERPPSKGSYQSVDNISVSVSTVPRGSFSTDLQRPLSISSVKPVICTPPPHQLCKETQTDLPLPDIGHEPVGGTTEEEIRISSARSRASLRNQFKNRLDETRHAVEERRTKSPIITLPSQKSVYDELVLDDDDVDDDDVDLPIPDDLKDEQFFREDSIDAGTSPPPVPRHSKRTSIVSKLNISEHPLVQQYLRAYTGVHNFKEALSRIMVDKDQMSASQILAELDMLPFDKESRVIPQIETMTENIYYVLNELSQVINSVLQNDRGPVVSSLMMGMSRDTTQRNFREKSGYTGDLQPPTRSSERSMSTKAESMISDSKYKELNDQYEKLQNQMSEDAKRYEEQQRHNMVVMMEMQDTINQLQRELSALGKQGRRPISESASTTAAGQSQQQQQDSAIMFTRLDSERNAKIMKKAVNEEKLDPNKYKEAVVQMDEYVSLPAQRLAHLVRKYVHHCRMKEIEENVQKSKSLNENVFEILDKMEALQNQRAKRWADRMDEMGMERLRLANMLMETLDGIEQDSGIFLIKPMYSYRGREPKDRFSTKTTRPLRPQRTLSPVRDANSAYAPAPTPASNVRPYLRQSQPKGDTNMYSLGQDHTQPRYESQGALEGNNTGLYGSSVNYVGIQPKETWSMSDSHPRMDVNPNNGTISNTPRILELDINRMMIGQNTISANIGNQIPSNDRLVNATSNNLRSYMTVNRPAGPSSAGKADRSTSGSRGMERSLSTPTALSPSSKHVRLADIEVPTVIPNTQPLPPIGRSSTTPDRPNSADIHQRTPTRIPSGDEIPASPPGSSLRQSPPVENDVQMS